MRSAKAQALPSIPITYGGIRSLRPRSRGQDATKKIFAYHICDWLVPTRDLLLDRGMMGDGVIDLPRIGGWIAQAGYRGRIEVEIFSKLDWWTRPGDEVLRTCIERYRAHCC